MIIGIGMDICDVGRMAEQIAEQIAAPGDGFVEAVFLPDEIAYCNGMRHPAEHFAARFAAKESVVKALAGAGGEGTFWQDIEIVREDTGQPRIALRGRLQELADGLGARKFHISLTHTATSAAAVVVVEG